MPLTPLTPRLHSPLTPLTPRLHMPLTPLTPRLHTPLTPLTPRLHSPLTPRLHSPLTPHLHIPFTPSPSTCPPEQRNQASNHDQQHKTSRAQGAPACSVFQIQSRLCFCLPEMR